MYKMRCSVYLSRSRQGERQQKQKIGACNEDSDDDDDDVGCPRTSA